MTSFSKIVGLSRPLPVDAETDAQHFPGEAVDCDTELAFLDHESGLNDLVYDEVEDARSRSWTAFIVPSFLVLTLTAWTGFFGWTYFADVQTALTSERIVALIGLWTIPALFLGVLWLLYVRSSRAEADRFGDVAKLLRIESEALEIRMRTVNEEIALAREFLAQNARELETLGRQSARNLVEAAEQLGIALADSDQKAKTLEIVSNAATTNLEQLRKHLPVVTSAAKDVTNQIGSAGNSAQLQVKSLIASLQRVGDAGKSTRESIHDMELRANEASEKLANSLGNSAAILNAVTGEAETRTDEMASLLASASGNLTNSVAMASAEVERVVAESAVKLESQLNALQGGIADLATQSVEEDARIAAILARISMHIEESAGRIAEVDATATDQTVKLAFALSALSESTNTVGIALGSNQHVADRLLESSEKLLIALEQASREIGETLPSTMDRMGGQFAQTLEQFTLIASNAEALDRYSDNMITKLASFEHLIEVQRSGVNRLMAESDEHFANRHEQADALATALQQTRMLVEELTDAANDKLIGSLNEVRETTKQVAESSRKVFDEELANVSERMSEQNKVALSNAVERQVTELNSLVQDAIERNFAMSEIATRKIAGQLSEIDEMTSSIEQRVAETRNSFDGSDDNSFARRMVLLTESLNSTAIDVAKILSNEVTDIAWAAYLKGDRGVFTRRAVRLLDAGEARTIADHYGEDNEFREHVNRYIHDFEAMMRVLLSTRDGNAICVTLLSSDVGKLYVALAQAIERLRN